MQEKKPKLFLKHLALGATVNMLTSRFEPLFYFFYFIFFTKIIFFSIKSLALQLYFLPPVILSSSVSLHSSTVHAAVIFAKSARHILL